MSSCEVCRDGPFRIDREGRDFTFDLTALELLAIKRLARSEPDGTLLAPLDEALDAMDAALKQRDMDAWVRADERFHRLLLELSGNARLTSMALTLWDQSQRARITTVRLRGSLAPSTQEHRAVVDAIRKGDWRDARLQHAKHRARTSDEILRLLEQTRMASF